MTFSDVLMNVALIALTLSSPCDVVASTLIEALRFGARLQWFVQ
jgi:hypothetical protein